MIGHLYLVLLTKVSCLSKVEIETRIYVCRGEWVWKKAITMMTTVLISKCCAQTFVINACKPARFYRQKAEAYLSELTVQIPSASFIKRNGRFLLEYLNSYFI